MSGPCPSATPTRGARPVIQLRDLVGNVIVRVFLFGISLIAVVLGLLVLAHLGTLASTGLPLLLEFLIFLGLLPTLMGLFVSVTPEDAAARRIAEREFQQAYLRRR